MQKYSFHFTDFNEIHKHSTALLKPLLLSMLQKSAHRCGKYELIFV